MTAPDGCHPDFHALGVHRPNFTPPLLDPDEEVPATT